jgi:hypothetical protein
MTELPKFYAVKMDYYSPLAQKAIDWFNEKAGRGLCQSRLDYYGHDINWKHDKGYYGCQYFEDNMPTILTLEQWDAIVFPKLRLIDFLKEGDEVFNVLTKEWETVQSLELNSEFPIITNENTYTVNGYGGIIDLLPTIYLTEYHPDRGDAFPQLPKELPTKFKKDDLVWVRDSRDNVWHVRFYSHYENGKHYCFSGQQKSAETDKTTYWYKILPFDQNPLINKNETK